MNALKLFLYLMYTLLLRMARMEINELLKKIGPIFQVLNCFDSIARKRDTTIAQQGGGRTIHDPHNLHCHFSVILLTILCPGI